MSLSGITHTEKYSEDRSTTRGWNDVLFDQPMPNNVIVLKQSVCHACGHVSYTEDAICPHYDSFMHRVIRIVEGKK